jgi:hypothetical protein
MSGLTWNDLSGDLRQSLCRVLELPSMAFVCISDARFNSMDDLKNFINHTRGLTGLSLHKICVPPHSLKVETEQGEDKKEMFERHPHSHLTFLDMGGGDWNDWDYWNGWNSLSFNLLLGPRSHFGVSHIHTLHITVHSTECDRANRLLRAIGSSLKHLSVILLHDGEWSPV